MSDDFTPLENARLLADEFRTARTRLTLAMRELFPTGAKVIIRGGIRGTIHLVSDECPDHVGAVLEHGHVRWFPVEDVSLA